MTKILSIGLGCLFLFGCDGTKKIFLKDVENSNLKSFASLILAKADSIKSQGEVHYQIFRLSSRPRVQQRIGRCYLQHGYGVTAELLKFKKISFGVFVKTYFGETIIRELLAQVCDEVLVAMQESNKTTILEMTKRTELFLKNVVCLFNPKDLNPSCAYIGHSKGGAVAFNIARRCMNRSSLLTERGCRHLKEIYSAQGVIQGAMATFVALGAYLLKEKNIEALFSKALAFELNLFWDINLAYTPGKTNPTWMDLSPLAPMEGNLTLYEINDIVLEKKGWLMGDFAASATDYHFTGRGEDMLFGCGENVQFNLNWSACRNFGFVTGTLHSKKLQKAFVTGLQAVMQNPALYHIAQNQKAIFDNISWEKYQKSDGLADSFLAISACNKGLLHKKNSVVKSCRVFQNLNHIAGAGANSQAIADILQQLKE